MCLGIPGKVTSKFREHDVLMGKVEFGGISRKVCLEHVPDVVENDYVLVHVGFALSKLDEVEAGRIFEFLEQMNQLDELDPPQDIDSPQELKSAGFPSAGHAAAPSLSERSESQEQTRSPS